MFSSISINGDAVRVDWFLPQCEALTETNTQQPTARLITMSSTLGRVVNIAVLQLLQ